MLPLRWSLSTTPMSYQHHPFDFYGLKLDTYKTPDDRIWVTLTSLAKGVGVHQQTTQNWLKRKDAPVYETLEVRVGARGNTKAWAYPAEVAADYMTYLVGLGKPGVIRVLSKSLHSDLLKGLHLKEQMSLGALEPIQREA